MLHSTRAAVHREVLARSTEFSKKLYLSSPASLDGRRGPPAGSDLAAPGAGRRTRRGKRFAAERPRPPQAEPSATQDDHATDVQQLLRSSALNKDDPLPPSGPQLRPRPWTVPGSTGLVHKPRPFRHHRDEFRASDQWEERSVVYSLRESEGGGGRWSARDSGFGSRRCSNGRADRF